MVQVLKKEWGLIQVPILVGLAIIAVTLPVLNTVVQRNQEMRGKAATSCGHIGEYCCAGAEGTQPYCLDGLGCDISGGVKCRYQFFACTKDSSYQKGANCKALYVDQPTRPAVCSLKGVSCWGYEATCQMNCGGCVAEGDPCCTSDNQERFCHNGLECDSGKCKAKVTPGVWYYCDGTQPTCKADSASYSDSAACSRAHGGRWCYYADEANYCNSTCQGAKQLYYCNKNKNPTSCDLTSERWATETECTNKYGVPCYSTASSCYSTCTPPSQQAYFINDQGCNYQSGKYNCSYGTVPPGKTAYQTQAACEDASGCDIKYARSSNDCITDSATGKGKYSCIASHYGTYTSLSSCEALGSCTPPPQQAYFINRDYMDRGCDHQIGKYNCDYGTVPVGEPSFTTKAACEDASGCDIKYARLSNECITDSATGKGKYSCIASHYGTYTSLSSCEALGSCTPLSYWTHDNTSCAATGKWACVKTSKGGAGTFTTEQACIDSDGCDVTYIRNYCDTAIGKWKCIYGQPQPGKPFYTDPIDETARISCENDLADGTCKAAWNGRWSRDNNGACDWATGRYSCIKDNNGKYQGSTGSDLPPSICTTDSSCFIPYLQGSCDDSTGNYSCQAVNYWDPNDPKLYLTKTQCEQAWGCGDKWRQGKCDWTTGKWICSRCTNPNDLTGCNYESESSCVEAIGCTVPVTRYSRVEGSCVNSRWQCQENQNGNFSDLNLCQNGACDEKKEWVYDTCNTQTGNWSCHKTTPDLGVFTTEEDCQKFDGCEVEKKCSVCSRAGYNGPDKSGGDYNCDGVVNLGDYAVWLNEFIKLVYREAITGYEADGDCFRNPELNFGTSLSDYSFWRDKYLH